MSVASYIVLALTIVHAAGFGYEDTKKWGENYPACSGKKQSPINVVSTMAKYDPALGKFKLSGFTNSAPYIVKNNGHTIQLDIGYEATSQGGGLPGVFKALQFHFHWSANDLGKGSEHLFNSKAFPLEVHIVHMNTKYASVTEALNHSDGLAVLGFFFEVGNANPAIGKFLNAIPAIKGNATSGAFSISDLIGSLSNLDDYFRYQGSLTTPPCSEAVIWTVFHKKLTISKDQLSALWKVKDSHGSMYFNYRPIQELNGRQLFTSIESSGMMTTAISLLVFFSTVLSVNLW